MPRQAGVSVEHNFSQGLITQASGLNFPENACTETYNCIFEETGPVKRRPQFDFESSYITQTIDRTNRAISTFQWRSIGEEGDFSVTVVQIGMTLYFYDNSNSVNLSRGYFTTSTIDLTTFASGLTNPELEECTYATGLGYLFVFHPGIDPIYISYNPSARTFTANSAVLKIRDLVGLDDAKAVDERPTTQTNPHLYNLYNQGWNVSAIKTNNVTFTNGSANIDWPNNVLPVGTPVFFTTDGALPTNFTANTTYYVVSTTTHVITVSATENGTAITAGSAGSGTHTGSTYNPYNVWINKRLDFPSNADVWWDFKDDVGVFDLKLATSVSRGTTPAPKGFYILDLFNQDRTNVSGVSGIAATTYTYRPSVGAFFAGRVWYSGIAEDTLNNNIYYSQIVESVAQIGRCYQTNDPTSQDLSVLLPTDGGVISILDIGTVFHMESIGSYLVLWASNGVWAITGSQGLGFSPTDYSVIKISDISSISKTSFVNTKQGVLWWNNDGIYALALTQQGFQVISLTDQRIKSFYRLIPLISKNFARGSYNPFTGVIQWLYRSTAYDDITEAYEYDRVLNLNTLSGAFYPWSLSSSTPKLNAVITAEVTGQSTIQTFNVVDESSNNVVDASGNQVIAFNFDLFSTTATNTKYLVSYVDGSSYKFTWAEASTFGNINDYKDWYTYDTAGVDYESYFISGYRLRGEGQRNFQATYLHVFSDTSEEKSIFDVSPRWDYSTTGNTGRWPSVQRVTLENNNQYEFQRRRLKIRGNGITIQFKYSSISGEPFNIVGWSIYETSNASI